jgi:S1-C subfamily serine protease
LAAKLELPETDGIYVVGTEPGGAAEKGGILWGDIILEINNTEIHTLSDAANALFFHKPDILVRFLLRRNGTLRLSTFRIG